MIKLRRWPLLMPLGAAVMGLALARTDMLDIAVAAVVLIVFTLTLLLLKQRFPALLLLLGALWGMADMMLDARSMVVPETWLAGEMLVTAKVEKVEQLSSSQRYLLRHIKSESGEALAGKALLYHYHYGRKKGGLSIQAGQQIRVSVRWRLPRNYHNPGAFDYRAWCFDRHIALIGSVRGSPQMIDATMPWLEMQRQKVRRAISKSTINSVEPDHGVLAALLLAERSQVSVQANRAFSATGTAHLLAISGMHIGMAAAWVLALVWFVLTRREAWIVRLPVRQIAMIAGVLSAIAYGTMAGWPLPAVRAAMMLAAAALAWCLASRSEPINTLLAALALILLFDAAAIASLSLWLSFVATAALLLWAGKLRSEETIAWQQRLSGAARSLLWISLLASLATLPMIIATFGRIPVYSLPANMIMVPLYAVVVMPAALLGELCALFGLNAWATGLMSVAGMAVNWGVNILSGLAALPAGELWAVHPPLALGLLYGLGMAWSGWLLWRNKRLKAACAASLVLAIYLVSVLHESDVQQPQWIVWDVGQGSASTLLLPGKQVIVVDAPGRSGSRFNGGTTVAAGLRALGLTHIDLLILSHAQSDHLGGALSLMRSVNRVGEIWLPDVPHAHAHKQVKAIESYAIDHAIPIRWMAKGDIDSRLGLQVLWPPRGYDPAKANNTSLVLLAKPKADVKLLWPGDIEIQAERGLLRAGLKKVEAMLMPHHGSRSSSHDAFVQALSPDLVVAQTGMSNRYGFPAKVVVQRYQKHASEVRNTAYGALLMYWPAEQGVAEVKQWSANNDQRRELMQTWLKSKRP